MNPLGSVQRASGSPLGGLLAVLRLALGTGDRKDQDAVRQVTDWPAVLRLANRHLVLPLFLLGLRSAGVRAGDPVFEPDAERRRRRHTARGMLQLEAMRQAAGSLAARGIPALFLKGLPLGMRLYGSPYAKTSIDIDLLVPPDAFAPAEQALREAGWRRSIPDFRETPARARRYDALEKEHVLRRHGGSLELHRRLLRNPYLFDPPFDSLYENRATVRIEGHAFRTLGDADQFLYLACHGSLHYWRRLKWLCDFGAFLRCIDGDALGQAAARGRAQRLKAVVAPALLLCRQTLRVPTPPGVAALCAGGPRARLVASVSRSGWTPPDGLRSVLLEGLRRGGRVFMGNGIRFSFHEVRGFLIQPRDFGTVNLPDRFFWLYFPLRPVLWLWRALRRQGPAAAGRRTWASRRARTRAQRGT